MNDKYIYVIVYTYQKNIHVIKQMVNLIIDFDLLDLNNKTSIITFYNTYRKYENLTPQSDAQFALNKLSNSPFAPFYDVALTPIQRCELQQIIEEEADDWTKFCDTLTLKQLQFVGW